MNNPGNSVLNEAGGSKEKKAGVFPIRYIAVLGFWRYARCPPATFSHRFNPLYRGTWFPTVYWWL